MIFELFIKILTRIRQNLIDLFLYKNTGWLKFVIFTSLLLMSRNLICNSAKYSRNEEIYFWKVRKLKRYIDVLLINGTFL